MDIKGKERTKFTSGKLRYHDMGSKVKQGIINNKYCTLIFNFLLYNLKMCMVTHKEQEIFSEESISLYIYLHRYISTYRYRYL